LHAGFSEQPLPAVRVPVSRSTADNKSPTVGSPSKIKFRTLRRTVAERTVECSLKHEKPKSAVSLETSRSLSIFS
jgi:hypothetical protein